MSTDPLTMAWGWVSQWVDAEWEHVRPNTVVERVKPLMLQIRDARAQIAEKSAELERVKGERDAEKWTARQREMERLFAIARAEAAEASVAALRERIASEVAAAVSAERERWYAIELSITSDDRHTKDERMGARMMGASRRAELRTAPQPGEGGKS